MLTAYHNPIYNASTFLKKILKPSSIHNISKACNIFLECQYKNLFAQERKGKRLEKAVNYARNHKETLMNYLLDGRCEISNNAAERRAKSYVMGRKNLLFHDTVDGAIASAVVLSLVETAKANNLNIYQYLYTLLLYMPDYRDEPAGVRQLMPWSEFIKERCSGVTDTQKETPENRGNLLA